MTVRLKEWEKPYTAGDWIGISTDKVISVLLREENNLIHLNNNNEIYTDLQIANNIQPTDNFEVWVTTGRVLESNGRPHTWTLLHYETTSGDYCQWLYGTDTNMYFDWWDGNWRQVYYSDQANEIFIRWLDFYWQTKTWATITLDLSSEITPESDFVVNAPTTIKEWQVYILRVNNGSTVYTMTLWSGIINTQGTNINLTAEATDMFVFLAIKLWGNIVLELQKEVPQWWGGGGGWDVYDWRLTIQKNGTTVQTFTANQSTNVTADIEVPSVVDDLTTQSSTNALSANQWYLLKWMIDDLAGFWKFLSLWNATTWQPISFPLSTPYTYSTWDYFVVETISSATPPVNYKPNGSSYTWTASSTAETDELEVWDVYVYDGAVWLLQSNHWKTVSFWNIAWDPYDNTNLWNALGDKQDVLTAWTNITIDTVTNTISATDTTYSSATTSTAWIVKLWNDTVITDTIASPWTTTWKTYPVQLNGSGQMWVNVPRSNTTYSASTWISINGSNQISNAWVISVNGNTWAVTVWDGDMSYTDFEFETATLDNWAIELSLSTVYTPTSNFIVNKPSTIKDWMQYLLRVENWATAYTMTLGTGVTNPYNIDLTLTANETESFVFLAVWWNLELQPTWEEKAWWSVIPIYYWENPTSITFNEWWTYRIVMQAYNNNTSWNWTISININSTTAASYRINVANTNSQVERVVLQYVTDITLGDVLTITTSSNYQWIDNLYIEKITINGSYITVSNS